ncbi:glycosyltransferase family 2 protein [Paraclostridium bifermentans]|uniref:glycosyltransferase family 2 protein n=1 Tax=Paraclostridium bifermentans TaxID=1490 RepID=UPI000683EBCE|nr:glycosyltransferase family 2 protein [Paraclostridium bifermentans]MCE9675094.1 glycosyltransferase family 2 protein [Paraclostridium bifermentans]
MKSLSVCMIVKNEEKNIKRCLDSIESIADEIIIVDTGSNDETLNICSNYNAKVINHKWNNDFSEARNVSLEYATKDYILFLDADEEISKEDLKKLKALLSSKKLAEGYFFRLTNIINGIEVGEYVVFRFFKNKRKYRFRGKVHEQIANCIQKHNKDKCIENIDIKIYHYGYDPNKVNIESKYKRNMGILNTYTEEEKDAYYFYVLGNEYARITDFKSAIESYEKSLDLMELKYNYVFYPYLILNIVKAYSNEKQFYDSIKFIEKIRLSIPNFKDLYFMECLAYIECGKISKALECLNEYINCPVGNTYEYPHNNFEKIYDIKEMKKNLEQASTPNNNLLSALMIIDKYETSIINTIKSFNEIVSNFNIVTSNKCLEITELKNIGAKIIYSDDKDLNLLIEKCKSKYIIMVDIGEICSTLSQKKIIELLSNTNENFFTVNIVNIANNTNSKEVRIIKNENSNFIDDYKYALIKNNNVVDSNIYIHKSFN